MSHRFYFNCLVFPVVFGGLLLLNCSMPSTSSAQNRTNLSSDRTFSSPSVEVDGLQFGVATSNHEINQRVNSCEKYPFFAQELSLVCTTDNKKNQMSSTSLGNEWVEVDGLQFRVFPAGSSRRFDTPIPQQNRFTIPAKSRSNENQNESTIHFVIEIRNTTDSPIYFNVAGTIEMYLFDERGRSVSQNKAFVNVSRGSISIDPRGSEVFILTGFISHDEADGSLYFSDLYGMPIVFEGLKPGKYRLQLIYTNDQDDVGYVELDPRQFEVSGETWEGTETLSQTSVIGNQHPSVKRSLWKGRVVYQPVEFYLVNTLP